MTLYTKLDLIGKMINHIDYEDKGELWIMFKNENYITISVEPQCCEHYTFKYDDKPNIKGEIIKDIDIDGDYFTMIFESGNEFEFEKHTSNGYYNGPFIITSA